MGIFGSDYESAGVGIPKNAPKKKGVFRFFELLFRKFWKLIQVNMLYSVFFIPILLAGYAFLRVSNSKIAAIIIIICLCAFAAVFGPATAQFERFNLACPRATVVKAMEQLKAALDNHTKWA